jgi:hypothetical protein
LPEDARSGRAEGPRSPWTRAPGGMVADGMPAPTDRDVKTAA